MLVGRELGEGLADALEAGVQLHAGPRAATASQRVTSPFDAFQRSKAVDFRNARTARHSR